MKRTLYYLLMLLLCAALLCGCASTKNAQPTPEPTATVSPTSPPTASPEPTPTPGLPDRSEYAQAYLNVIDRYLAEYADNPYVELTYDLIDFDGDEPSELVLSGESFIVVYTYADKSAYKVFDGGYGAGGNFGYEYLPGQNVMRNIYDPEWDVSRAWVSYYQMEESHELKNYYDEVLYRLTFEDINHNQSYDEGERLSNGDDGEYYYYYGNEQITYEEFQNYMIPGEYQVLIGTKTYDEIVKTLMNV